MQFSAALESSIHYLRSEEARRSLAADPYWPKWHSPWWHMLLLHEMGETARIPPECIRQFVAAVSKYPVKIFPIQPSDMPAGVDPYRGCPCHCQLGNVYQVLAAAGVNVDLELPWIRPWLLAYQMADGGMNCDNEAYLVQGECPSSMVGTIAAFEAILLYTPRPWTREEEIFLDKAAHFLMDRKLMYGSQTKHNAAEREEARAWIKPCFPRFYLYDILRGLNALTLWAEKRKQELAPEAIREALSYLQEHFPDGSIQNERHSYESVGTLLQNEHEWKWQKSATFFPLLQEVSALGATSPFLTKQWQQIRARVSL